MNANSHWILTPSVVITVTTTWGATIAAAGLATYCMKTRGHVQVSSVQIRRYFPMYNIHLNPVLTIISRWKLWGFVFIFSIPCVPDAAGRRFTGLVRAVGRGPALQRGCGLVAVVRYNSFVLYKMLHWHLTFATPFHLCSALGGLNGKIKKCLTLPTGNKPSWMPVQLVLQNCVYLAPWVLRSRVFWTQVSRYIGKTTDWVVNCNGEIIRLQAKKEHVSHITDTKYHNPRVKWPGTDLLLRRADSVRSISLAAAWLCSAVHD